MQVYRIARQRKLVRARLPQPKKIDFFFNEATWQKTIKLIPTIDG